MGNIANAILDIYRTSLRAIDLLKTKTASSYYKQEKKGYGD